MNTKEQAAQPITLHWAIETIGLEVGVSSSKEKKGKMNEIALVISLFQDPDHDSSTLNVIDGAIFAMIPGILNGRRFMEEFASLAAASSDEGKLLDKESLQDFIDQVADPAAGEYTLDLIEDRLSEAGVVLTLDPRSYKVPAIEVISNQDGEVRVKVYTNESDPARARAALRPFIEKMGEGGFGSYFQAYKEVAIGF